MQIRENEELLKNAVELGIMDIEEIATAVEEMRRKEVLKKHKFKIWQDNKGRYLTYIQPEGEERMIRRRKTKEELENLLIEFYAAEDENIVIKDVFEEWINQKLENREVKKQSYDRYFSDFKKYFDSSLPVCQKKIKNIGDEDLECFLKSLIDKEISRKSFSGVITLLKGIFCFAKKRGYTNFSILNFLGEFSVPKNAFKKKYIEREKEVFNENEIPILINYLKLNHDIWNLGLLLQFQTGMRIGEISALKKEDFFDKFVRVQRTEVKYKDEEGHWKVKVSDIPKTDAGRREVVLTEKAKETIKLILEENPDGEFLFENKGKRIRENTFNKRLSNVLSKLGMPPRSTHKIRKTYGTLLLDADVDDVIVAEMMGHTSVETTRKLYYFSNKKFESKFNQVSNAITF